MAASDLEPELSGNIAIIDPTLGKAQLSLSPNELILLLLNLNGRGLMLGYSSCEVLTEANVDVLGNLSFLIGDPLFSVVAKLSTCEK